MISSNKTNKKLLYTSILVIAIILSLIAMSGVGAADNINNYEEESQYITSDFLLSTITDGYLYDEEDAPERDGVRVVDFSLAATDVPANSTVESEIIIANYGVETVNNIRLEPYITDSEGDVLDSDEYESGYESEYESEYELQPLPRPYYEDISLKPGEHKVYKFTFNFDKESSNEYEIGFINTSAPENRPMATETININNEYSGSSDTFILNKERLTIDDITITRYKDENVFRSSSPGASSSLPPVEKNDDGTITDSDVAVGAVSDFGNIRSNSDIYGSITSSNGEIDVGFSTENVPSANHYAISLIYDLENINSAELNLVTATGDEIDENSSYYISSPEDGKKERVFQLTEDEIDYIESQREVYFTYDNVDNTQNNVEIKIYEMNVIALSKVWNIPESELSAELNSTINGEEITAVQIGDDEEEEDIEITANITNDGSVSVNKQFRLTESQLSDGSTVDISDKVIINPGDTKTVRFIFPVSKSGEHVFNLLGETITVSVDEAGEGVLRQSISSNKNVIGVGGEIEFSRGDLPTEDEDRITKFEWRLKNDADYTNVNEDTVTKQYDEAGSYSVTLKTEYEDSNGDTKIHRTQTVIDVIDGPEPNIGATQYQFTVDDQEVNGEVIGSTVTGQMRAGTCSNYCGGAFSFDGIGLAISEGINMLVLEADRDGNQYNPVHYGTYDVNNDAFATTNTVTSDGMDSIRNSMSNGGTSGASQNLIDDINNLKGENRYFMFVSGGNPLPTQKSSEVFSTLESLGADLNGGNTKELEQNSMWTFTTQTLSNDDVTPLQESYVPDSSNLPAISHDYSLEPVRVTDMNNVIPNRPVHYDLEQMDIVGSLSETTVVWTMYDDSTIDNELYTSEIYTTEDTEHTVSVYAEDYLGLEGSGDRTVQTNTVNPVASIPDISPAVEENSLLYTLDSYDSDSTIKEYTWKLPKLDEEGSVIDGENVIYNERNPEHFWNYAGQYNVELTVEDRYGNTNTTTKSMQILGSPPKANADITRVTSNFRVNDRFDITNVVPNRPILYYPLDFSDGITQEYARSLDGTIDGSLSQVSGASEDTQALRFDGSSSIRVPNNANNKISEQVAISAWVKTREDGTIYSAIDGTNDNSITLRTSESNPDFEVVSNGEPIGLNFNTNIKNGEWNHIVASYDIVEGLKLYVNGELDNSNSRDVGTLNIDSKPTKIGADARGNAGAGNFIGDISNIQMYDMRLNEEDAVDIYNNNGNTLVDVSNQGVFYEFGEPYHDTSKSTSKSSGLGTVDNLEDHYNIISSSNVDNEDSEQYLEIENVDYSQYNTIYMTYDAEFYREITQGADITGIISIESEGQKSERIVYNDMNVRDNGVMSFDVSNIDTTESLYVSAKSFGSNRGYTNLEVYEIWGNTGSQTNYPSRTEFYDSVYPDISSNTDIHETRNGVRISQRDITAQKELGNIGEPGIQHNIIPVGNANSVNVQHNIRTQSANIYGDSSGSYTLGSGAVNPISIFCESSSLLRTPCSNTGNSPDELTLDSSSYSHVGLETGLLDGDTIIESFGVNSETSSTMYPTVHFDGSTSSGSGAGIYIKEYEWDLSTDTSFRADYVGETFTHKFNEIGTHSVALRTTDTFGETSTEVFNFNVSNLEPTIRAQFTTETDLGSEATFTAGAESPGEGEIQQIIWDMGDGNYLQGEDISYEYSTGGEYDVTVIAIDDAGLTTSETRTIRVAGSDPDLEGITTSARAHVLDTVLFDTSGNGFDSLNNEDHPRGVQSRIDLTAAEDPNGGELTFNWNFLSRSLFNVDNPHLIIADIGTSTFGVTAQNSERRTKSKEITIETYNNGPSLELDVDTPIDEVEDENLDGITFVSEPVDVTVNANHPHERIGGEITVDMGDGTTKTHTVPDDADSSYTYTFEHQYDINPDEYSRQDFSAEFVTQAQIEDDFGATAEDSKNIEVQHRGVEIYVEGDIVLHPDD